MKLAAALFALALFAGCSAPATAPPVAPGAAALKASCDALGPIVKEFGQVAPTATRYAEFQGKVRDVMTAGDAATKAALTPLVTALGNGATGADGALVEFATASAGLVGACVGVGSTAYAASAPSATPTATATDDGSSDLSDQDLADLLEPSDFKVGIKILTKQCFGSAGCNLTFRIKPSFVGVLDMPSTGTTEITYKVKGGDDPMVNTFTVDGEGTAHFDGKEFISTPHSWSKLKAVVTDVSWSEE